MFKNLQQGSVIYDLAAVQGGNTAAEADKIIDKNGTKILGEGNILNKLPVSASNLYSKMYLILFLIYMINKIRN